MGRANSSPAALACTKYLTLCRFEIKKKERKKNCDVVAQLSVTADEMRRRYGGGALRGGSAAPTLLAFYAAPLQPASVIFTPPASV